ncbi:response regulator [uncultured Pseudodesulfovibrio sp.]|uniref:response regulator n=1 Tax=uncultured Pseudodesulfovibrio sp. TaxID=2035858 RepID=UPI0029C97BE7|nr:response regulator [uncultured Pseudodesulfovibrio sp.]
MTESLRVLIADDSTSALYALKTSLAPTGAILTTAMDGLEAQHILEKQAFDLIITDVDMPKLDGLKLCDWIKNNPNTAATPVIILSSRESDQDIDNGFRVGADGYVPKSSAVQELIPRIEQVLNKTAMTKNRILLVVDDSEAIRTFLHTGLSAEDFEVLLARDGKEAMEILAKTSPDLILSDLMMPNMDGKQLCHHIKTRDDLKNIPFVIMSSVQDKAIMHRTIHDGAASYITKPFGINNLVQIIDKILSEQFRVMLVERDRLQAERRMTFGSIASLVKALEARDHYTSGHSESVTHIAMHMAKRLNFTDDQIIRLHIAGNLHDLGKIGVRDNVLLKPDKLTDEEFEHIKSHTTVVVDILDPLPGMEDVLVAASSHHERWDGTGYPTGLKGEDIPLLGRILAVADVFDAMTCDRVYRKGMSKTGIRDFIFEERGKKFCPECVDAFMDWYTQSDGIVAPLEDWGN